MFYVNYISIKLWKKRLSPKNQMSWSLHHNKTTNNITASFGTKSDQPANTSSKCSLYGVNKISLRENKENFWSFTTPQWKPFSTWVFPSNLIHFQSTLEQFSGFLLSMSNSYPDFFFSIIWNLNSLLRKKLKLAS